MEEGLELSWPDIETDLVEETEAQAETEVLQLLLRQSSCGCPGRSCGCNAHSLDCGGI